VYKRQVSDRATFTEAFRASVGVKHLLVGGRLAVVDGVLDEGLKAGRPVRAPVSP